MEKHIIWKATTALLSFLLICCVGLISISYSNLVSADDQCIEKAEKIEQEVKTNCVKVTVQEARIKALEENRASTKQQLDVIERLLTRTATIVERLEKKIDNGNSYPTSSSGKRFGETNSYEHSKKANTN